jgi:hypothetical protein
MPVPLQAEPKDIQKRIQEDYEVLKRAREQHDDLGAALAEDEMNKLLDKLGGTDGD